MFTYVRLKNFMSIGSAFFDFRSTKKSAKKFVAIYGENGSGKSNFVNSISFLRRSIDSFNMGEIFSHMQDTVNNQDIPSEIRNKILNGFAEFDFSSAFKECRMIGNDDETRIEYGFMIDGHQGNYEIAFKDSICYERLYYYTGRQSGLIFEITKDGRNIRSMLSPKLCTQDNVKKELELIIQQYWGKHSLLSMLNNERDKKNDIYIQEHYLKYVFDLIDMLEDSMIHQKKTFKSGCEYRSKRPYNALDSLDEGRISKENVHLLDFSEKVLREFFCQAYADIKNVFYDRTEQKDSIRYELFMEKMIGGEIRTIPFHQESAGTQHVLQIIRSLLGAFSGVTVVYDEIDDGIHDLLLKNILTSMIDDITGQLIITTHNTLLLEEMDVKSIYIIDIDYSGEKEVHCLSEFPRIQGSNNPRRMYLKGMFGGVPIPDMVDYTEIITELEQLKKGE